MNVIELFSDGGFNFGRTPTCSWVAVSGDDGEVAHYAGRCPNDGSNNAAGEVLGALLGLQWAVAQGFRAIIVHSDLNSLAKHFDPFRIPRRKPRKNRVVLDQARQWVMEHPDVKLTFVYTPDSHPKIRKAHDLCRSVAA